MANINDWKILNNKCRIYFGLLETELGKTFPDLSDKQKERFGFYLFVLETICKIRDISDIIPLICDEDFNSTIFNIKDDDWGLDAAFIDSEEHTINLFNFKFRKTFNPDKKQSPNETLLTTKFTTAFVNQNTNGMTGKLETIAKNVITNLRGATVWKLRFYVVSNEARELDGNSPQVSQLKDIYGLEVIPVGLATITNMMTLRPDPINAIIHVNNDSVLPYKENSLSSSVSYIIRISANELIRISCNNSELREDYQMEEYSKLYHSDMEYNLLFDNVRGFIINSKFNPNLIKTLREEPSKFFMYNNGLTITANDITTVPTNGNQKLKISIKDFQVVNGGQTLRTLHAFMHQDPDNVHKYLSECELLLRVFKTSSEGAIRNRIAEYTNSQNAISSIDLKSLSPEQIQIEQYLDDHNIIYARKIGDTGLSSVKKYIHKISMEKFGQILFSILGYPEKASNQKKDIFEKHYDLVFKEPNFELTKSVDYIKRYFEIKKEYESLSDIGFSDQKIFYILYVDNKFDAPIKEKIDFLEKSIKDFNLSDRETLSDARKLLLMSFREKFDTDVAEYISRKK